MKDKFHATYFLFYALGVSTAIPSNFFTTATDYWMYKFRDPGNETYSDEHRTHLQADFISNISIVSHVSSVVSLLFALKFLRGFTIQQRIISSLCGAIVMFLFTVVFVIIDTDTWQFPFYILTLIIQFFLTGFCSTFMVTVFEMVARFPATYIVAILTGQSICGILAAIVQIASLGMSAESTASGLIYFLFGTFFLFLSLLAYIMMIMKSEFFQFYLAKDIQTEKADFGKESIVRVINQVKYFVFAMAIVLGTTIIVHPGVTSLVVSMGKGNNNRWNDVFFVPVVTFLLYNIFDYIGRELAAKLKKPKNGVVLLLGALLRVMFVPMILYCNAQPRPNGLPVTFNTDYAYILIIILFSISHGFLNNVCVLRVPESIEPRDLKLAMGMIIAFMLISLGLFSFLGPVMVKTL